MEAINHRYHRDINTGRHVHTHQQHFLLSVHPRNNRSVPETHSSYFKEQRDSARSLARLLQ